MVLYGNTAEGLEEREEWFAIPAEWRAGGGCNSAGLSHALGASSVSCLVFESLLYLEQTDCLQSQILQHMHYLMPSTGMYVVLRFTTGPWVTGRAVAPAQCAQFDRPGSASWAGLKSMEEELGVWSKANVEKGIEGRCSSSGVRNHFSGYHL